MKKNNSKLWVVWFFFFIMGIIALIRINNNSFEFDNSELSIMVICIFLIQVLNTDFLNDFQYWLKRMLKCSEKE